MEAVTLWIFTQNLQLKLTRKLIKRKTNIKLKIKKDTDKTRS